MNIVFFSFKLYFLFPLILLSFGKLLKGSEKKISFNQWESKVKLLLDKCKKDIPLARELLENESPNFDDLKLFYQNFLTLKHPIDEIRLISYKIKKNDKISEKALIEEIEACSADVMFFLDEIKIQIAMLKDKNEFESQLESQTLNLKLIDNDLAGIARNLPRISNTGELKIFVEKHKKIINNINLIPEKLKKPKILPDELKIKLERFNFKLNEISKNIITITNSIEKQSTRLNDAISQLEQKEKLHSIHVWIDSIEFKIKKVSNELANLENEIENPTSLNSLINMQKQISGLEITINNLKHPDYELKGETQTTISVSHRLTDIEILKTKITKMTGILLDTINNNIANTRTTILERYFLRNSKLTITRINYILGLKNELILQNWISQFNLANPLRLEGKFIILSKKSHTKPIHKRDSFYNAILDFTKFERQNDDISHRATINWVIKIEKMQKL